MDKAIRELFRKRNVVSVGIGRKVVAGMDTGREAVVVGVVKKVMLTELSPGDIIPQTINGKETDVIEVGEIKALKREETDRTRRWRPAPGGVSVGHKNITAGTLGCCVRKGNERFMLSNNHVLANTNEAQIGDEILQPGAYDGGIVSNDTIGRLAEFVEIELGEISDCPVARAVADVLNLISRIMGSRTRLVLEKEAGENLVDCAIATPGDDRDIDQCILGCGIPERVVEPELGMKVKKSGRTTGLTIGEITQVEATVNVNMGEDRYAYFVDQFIVSGEFSQGGDSGSLILDEGNNAVGLLFAGSDSVTVGNCFCNVIKTLKITLD
jgi:hypothetical protein